MKQPKIKKPVSAGLQQILTIMRLHGIDYVTEHRFHPIRRWRFDAAIVGKKIAIEYNGIMSNKSRHTTITGYTGDMDKLNAAQILGWIVLQYTPLNLKQFESDLIEALSITTELGQCP